MEENMEDEMFDLAKEVEGMSAFPEYYDWPENVSAKDYALDHLELCKIARPVNLSAQALTTVMSVAGILMNCVVIYVMVILKEYRKTNQQWLLLHFLVTNVAFLLFVFFQMVNEHQAIWVMGDAMCKLDEAAIFTSRSAGIVILVLSNLLGIFSFVGATLNCPPTLPWMKNRVAQAVKSAVVLMCVWIPCAMVNLPLYRYKNVDDCERCVLEFPIDINDLCPLLGLNSTTCVDVMHFFEAGVLGNATAYATRDYDDDYSGSDLDTQDLDKMFENNITEMAQRLICDYEEPRSFFVWLLASFTIFYAVPMGILVVFGCLWFYDAVLRKNEKNRNQNKTSLLNVIFVLDVIFVIFWTPWNAVHMKKAYGGLGTNGYQCASLIHYARLSAIIYIAFAPIVYATLTKNFRTRMRKALNLSTSFCYDILKISEKPQPESSKCERTTSSGDRMTVTTTDASYPTGSFTESTSPVATPV